MGISIISESETDSFDNDATNEDAEYSDESGNFDEKDLGLNYKYSEDVFPIKVPMKNCTIMTVFDYNNPKTLFFEYFDNNIVLKNSNIKGLVTSYFFKNNDCCRLLNPFLSQCCRFYTGLSVIAHYA